MSSERSALTSICNQVERLVERGLIIVDLGSFMVDCRNLACAGIICQVTGYFYSRKQFKGDDLHYTP